MRGPRGVAGDWVERRLKYDWAVVVNSVFIVFICTIPICDCDLVLGRWQ